VGAYTHGQKATFVPCCLLCSKRVVPSSVGVIRFISLLPGDGYSNKRQATVEMRRPHWLRIPPSGVFPDPDGPYQTHLTTASHYSGE